MQRGSYSSPGAVAFRTQSLAFPPSSFSPERHPIHGATKKAASPLEVTLGGMLGNAVLNTTFPPGG